MRGRRTSFLQFVAASLLFLACFAISTPPAVGTTLQDGLVGYYPFDGNPNDASGNNNNGTTFGGVSLTSDRFGNPASAYLFDGATGYIRVVGSSNVLNVQNSLTLTAWLFNTPGNFSPQRIVNKIDAGNLNTGYMLTAWWANPLGNSLELYDQSHAQHIIADGLAPSLNAWEMVTGTWDGTTMSIYRNGALKATSPFSGTLGAPTQDLFIGAIVGFGFVQQFFHGAIDDVRIYDRALAPSEVLALAQLPLAVPEPATLALLFTGLAGLSFARRRKIRQRG